MVQDEKKAAVYVAFSTFRTALDALDAGLPLRIDTSVWPTLAGGVRGHVISAFKFLGLIDAHGNVLPDLVRFVAAEDDDRKAVLREIMERSYPTIIEIGQTNASSMQLHEVMREYNVTGDTLDKAVRFYLQAGEYCGLPISRLWKKRKGARRGGERRKAGSGRPSPTDWIALTFKSGGSVRLGVTIDVTRLSAEDRRFVFELIDRMNAYKEGLATDAHDEETEVEEEGREEA